jgi:hypothetical protein
MAVFNTNGFRSLISDYVSEVQTVHFKTYSVGVHIREHAGEPKPPPPKKKTKYFSVKLTSRYIVRVNHTNGHIGSFLQVHARSTLSPSDARHPFVRLWQSTSMQSERIAAKFKESFVHSKPLLLFSLL